MNDNEAMKIEWVPIEKVQPYPKNARKRSAKAIEKIAASIKEFSWRQPLVVDDKYVIICGHGRLDGAKHLGLTQVPVHIASDLTPAQVKAYRLADNRLNEESEWDLDLLGPELADLKLLDFDLQMTGFDLPEIENLLGVNAADEPRASLIDRFGVPPFSVLDARQGYWQARKTAWLALGIQSELGRGGHLEGVRDRQPD